MKQWSISVSWDAAQEMCPHTRQYRMKLMEGTLERDIEGSDTDTEDWASIGAAGLRNGRFYSWRDIAGSAETFAPLSIIASLIETSYSESYAPGTSVSKVLKPGPQALINTGFTNSGLKGASYVQACSLRSSVDRNTTLEEDMCVSYADFEWIQGLPDNLG